MNIARELIDDGYKSEKYRSVYGNPDFRIHPPSIDGLEEDPTLLPPKPVQEKAGCPKGKRKGSVLMSSVKITHLPDITSAHRRRRKGPPQDTKRGPPQNKPYRSRTSLSKPRST